MNGLGKLILMLSSPNDGEALNAVRLLGKALAKAGHDWFWLAALADSGRSEPPPKHHHEDIEDHQAAADWLLANVGSRLRSNEIDFLETMQGWRGDPTPRQAAWLATLCAKWGYRR